MSWYILAFLLGLVISAHSQTQDSNDFPSSSISHAQRQLVQMERAEGHLGISILKDLLNSAAHMSHLPNPVKDESDSGKGDELDKRAWKDLSYGWGKRGWQDLQSSGWGKRAWRDMQGAWGKRGWSDLQSTGWGKRAWQDMQSELGKRGWSDLQSSGWGKRGWKDLQSTGWGKRGGWQDKGTVDGRSSESFTPDSNFKDDVTKRSWNALHGAWGKRAADWSSFRGSWGKRDPAWQNLKGLWGKRNYGGFMESFDPGFNNMDDETRRDK